MRPGRGGAGVVAAAGAGADAALSCRLAAV